MTKLSFHYTLTSYSPCFRKEKGAHGIEERGVYRIHQFEKQEMIVVCKPEDSKEWYEKMWKIHSRAFQKPWMYRYVHLSAVQEILQTLRLNHVM